MSISLMKFNQESYLPAESSVTASEIRKMLQHEVRMEIEFCLSEEGLREFPNIADIIKNSPTQSVPTEILLTIPRLKELGITKVDLYNAISESDHVEINGDGTGIRRKDIMPLKEVTVDAAPIKKRKTEEGSLDIDHHKRGRKSHEKEPKLFKITLSEPIKKMKDSKFQSEIEKNLGKEIAFARLYGTEGYFALDATNFTEEDKKRAAHMDIQIGNAIAKIQECWDDDLDEFYKKNGHGLDQYLERAGQRRKHKDEKDEVDLVFYNNKYVDIAPLEYIFSGILCKNLRGGPINPADTQLLQELLQYHEKSDFIRRDLDHFEVGFHPQDPSLLTFFAVRKTGEKEPFSFKECADGLLDNFIEPKRLLQK